jgi:hypothetical protein
MKSLTTSKCSSEEMLALLLSKIRSGNQHPFKGSIQRIRSQLPITAEIFRAIEITSPGT